MASEDKPKLTIVNEELDEDEIEFKKLRRDLPGVKGASAAAIMSIHVSKAPEKNGFFRTHPDFMPVVAMVDTEVGMEKQFFVVTDEMVAALAGIGITVTLHRLYMIITPEGAVRIIPVNIESDNDYHRTKETGLIAGKDNWVRLYTDQANKNYKMFPAPAKAHHDPIWPEIKHAKAFRIAFRDKGRMIDSIEHPLFLKWAARGKSK